MRSRKPVVCLWLLFFCASSYFIFLDTQSLNASPRQAGIYLPQDSSQAGEVHVFGNAGHFECKNPNRRSEALRLSNVEENCKAGSFQNHLSSNIVSMAEAPSGEGYWALSDEGIVSASGSVRHLGDLAALGKVNALSSSIDIAASPNGKGYWITTSTGVVYAFGSTRWHGATGHLDLPTSIVDIEPSPTGDGYWLTSAGGDIFAFGDAKFHGSAKEINLYRPAVDLISNPSGDGYWLVGSDGSVNGFGSAKFHGSLGHNKLSSTQIIGGHGTSDGNGYWLIGHRGGIFAFGSAYYAGSINASATAPVGAFAFDRVNKGYWLVTKNSPAVPSNSGIGKRAIFSNRLHRVWLVNDDETVHKSYLVSGKADTPIPGDYSVFSKSRRTVAGHDDISMEYMVRFTWGNTQAIGFHSIPNGGNGEPLQTEAQLGTYRSEGCIRLRNDQAKELYDWMPVGTPVIVTN